jgi:uncharacterized protein (TIGR02246 family)
MSAQTQATTQDEQAIRNIAEQFEAAWNRNDAKRLAAFFADDGDIINPGGRIARGKTEVEKLFTEEQNGAFKGTRFSMPLKHLRFLKPDIAVAEYEFEINGVQGPQQTMKGLVTSVLQRDADKWLIASVRPMVPIPLPSRS